MIKFQCKCGKQYGVSEKHAGKTTKCRNCGNPITVPTEYSTEIDASRHVATEENVSQPNDVGASIARKNRSAMFWFLAVGLLASFVLASVVIWICWPLNSDGLEAQENQSTPRVESYEDRPAEFQESEQLANFEETHSKYMDLIADCGKYCNGGEYDYRIYGRSTEAKERAIKIIDDGKLVQRYADFVAIKFEARSHPDVIDRLFKAYDFCKSELEKIDD